MNFTETFKAHEHEGSTYQPGLRKFLREHTDLKTLVESGSGCSTVFMTMALEERGVPGKIYSLDPSPWCSYTVEHPFITNIRKKSEDAMVDLYLQDHPWDFFLHDGNHDIFQQSYDIWMGFALLRPGGWIWCDDYTWGEHHAWKRFAAQHGLTPHHFGSASGIQKPDSKDAMHPSMVAAYSEYLKAKFRVESDAWHAAGNKDSSVFAHQV